MNSGATWQSPAHKPGRMALKWEWPRSEQFNIDPDVVGLEAPRPTLGGGDIKWGYSVRKGSTDLCCLSSPLQTNALRFVVQNGIHTSQPSWDKAVFPGPASLKAMNARVQMASLSQITYNSSNFFPKSAPFVFSTRIHSQQLGSDAHLVRR